MGMLSGVKNYTSKLDEAISAFKNKANTSISSKTVKSMSGEGIEYSPQFDSFSTSSLNMFYSNYINKTFNNERSKIVNYRNIAEMPEVADVIEDACIESTQEDLEGKVLVLDIQEEELKKNKNVINKLQEEFNDLFYNRIKLQEKLYDFFRTYFIDGRFYYERIIDETNTKNGIIGIKKLPTETMDFEYDHITGKVKKYKQYINPDSGRKFGPTDKETIDFEPAQIGLVDYGIYGKYKNEIFGYLEKVKVPYNTLKLLETSIIIYRIVRAPERLVFSLDVGNMPRDKAMKYVEKVKQSMMKKQSYDPSTGRLTQNPDVLSISDNFFVSSSSEGRGSTISTVGGSSTAGFTELGDVKYFQRKLYQSLKYPASRISAMQSDRESEILFTRSPAGEISRDEIKWAVFLERQQTRFCNEWLNLFLLHLEFKGLKAEYELGKDNLTIKMTQPSFYKEKQEQILRETKFNNYLTLSGQPEFSKYFLMQKYLQWDEDDIKANVEGMKQDYKLGFKVKEQANF